MDNKSITRFITIFVIALLFIVAVLVLKPILISIIIGLLLAYIFHPVYEKIHSKVKRKNLSAVILIFGMTIIIIVPLIFVIPMIVRQMFESYIYLQGVNFADAVTKFFPSLFTADSSRVFAVNFNSFVSTTITSLMNEFTVFIVNFPTILLHFAVILFTFYFSVRDADKLKEYLVKLSPFSLETEKKFGEEFRNITDAVIYGQILIGVVQGLTLGIGLFFLGVPKFLVLTLIAIIASTIPILGSWLVWLPTGLFMIISGNQTKGVILLLYGLFFVSIIDNVLRPYFLSKKSSLSLPLSIIGVIGGLYSFGIIGLVLGPLIMAYAMIVVDFYKQGRFNELFKQ